MENKIVEEICKKLKWYDIIIVKLFKSIFVRVYHKTRTSVISDLLQ